jgi:hypothetical protein
MEIKSICPECKKVQTIHVETEDFLKWRKGLYIQAAFPYLGPSEREALMTGYCDTCWDVLFGFEDFEEEFANV